MAKSIWNSIQEALAAKGVHIGINQFDNLADIGLEDLENLAVDFGFEGGPVKVVCVSPDLKTQVDEMSATQRDKVVMVRVDETTQGQLDDWVATGAVKSRSEAAALFIREGLAVRSDELESLREALSELEAARDRLKKQAEQIFGGGEEEVEEEEEEEEFDGVTV